MDPAQTWLDMQRLAKEEMWLDVIEHAEALQSWLSRGGFEPIGMDRHEFYRLWHKANRNID